jgi:DNA-binding NtrC family response regulator
MNSEICILFVDDEIDICEKLAASFELEDFKVYTANCGNHAIEVLNQHPEINFVISDVKMPNGDGIFLLKHIKSVSPQIPVILLSGFTEKTEAELLSLGALALVGKPTDIDKLIEFVKQNRSK